MRAHILSCDSWNEGRRFSSVTLEWLGKMVVNIRRYLFLVVFDGQFELRQVVTLPGVQLLALVVSVVQDGFQLSGAPGLVQKVFGKALALLRQLLVLLPKLVLHLRGRKRRFQGFYPLRDGARVTERAPPC